MELKGKRGRGVSPGLIFVGACLLCLTTGFFTGKLYGEKAGAGPAPGSNLVVAGRSVISNVFGGKATPAKTLAICTNTCAKANDGVCDDGRTFNGTRPESVRRVHCDLGTDCNDCGAWEPSGPITWAAPGAVGPIQLLNDKLVEVRVRRSTTEPQVDFAFTDPTKDFDVSHHMEFNGGVEMGITKIFYTVLKNRCVSADGSRRLMVDVGANFGWFAVYAAKMGCRVIAFEPVPHFRAFLEYSVHLNGLAHLVDIRSNVVSHESGKTMEMVVPGRGIWGTAGIGGLNIDRAVESTKESIQIPSFRLEDVVAEDVLLMKVDVEGWEWAVMQGAANLMTKFNVRNVVMEYSPGVPERHFKFDDIISTVQMLIDLVGSGYRIGHIGDAGKHLSSSWDAPLRPLTEVTAQNLKYDLADAHKFKHAQLGCPAPPDLKAYQPWGMCNGVPEDISPRSLRSEIGHNTNLWASKEGNDILPLEGTVGILDPNAPAEQYFITNANNFGMGSRPCAQLIPLVQVRHRCKCTMPNKCGEEEKAVEEAAKAGKLPSNYVLS